MRTPRTATNVPAWARNNRLLKTANVQSSKDRTKALAILAATLIIFAVGLLSGILFMTAVIVNSAN